MSDPSVVIQFWFHEIPPNKWFAKDVELDALIQQRFEGLHGQAARGELFQWRLTPEGRLAEIILLDQFSRNIYRNQPRSFAYDPVALVLAQEAVQSGDDGKVPVEWRSFFYLPYMHSESKMIHEEAVKLFSVPGLELNLDFEFRHKKIIDRFGRFPHRNAVLGRSTTPEEAEFLRQPGSGF